MPKVSGTMRKRDGSTYSTRVSVVKNKAEPGVLIFIEGKSVLLNEKAALRLSDLIVDRVENWEPR